MTHGNSHEAKPASLRWGVVVRVVLAACVIAFIAGIAWYVDAIMIPAQENAAVAHQLDEFELHSLSNRMLRVETVLHLR